MTVIVWALREIVVYGIWFIPFISLPTLFAYRLGWKGLLLGHFLVAICIAVFDYRWIQSEMSKPGWNGLPDMDIVFYFGVLARIAMVNVISLPIGTAAIFAARRRSEMALGRGNPFL